MKCEHSNKGYCPVVEYYCDGETNPATSCNIHTSNWVCTWENIGTPEIKHYLNCTQNAFVTSHSAKEFPHCPFCTKPLKEK